MNVVQKFQASLASHALSVGWDELIVLDGKLEINIQLAALDRLACAFTSLTVSTPTLYFLSPDRLQAVAEQISSRITYLLEPIAPIEIDSERCVVQLRSSPPQKDEDRTTYYELLVERQPAEIS